VARSVIVLEFFFRGEERREEVVGPTWVKMSILCEFNGRWMEKLTEGQLGSEDRFFYYKKDEFRVEEGRKEGRKTTPRKKEHTFLAKEGILPFCSVE
jgi:hypothetical protein